MMEWQQPGPSRLRDGNRDLGKTFFCNKFGEIYYQRKCINFPNCCFDCQFPSCCGGDQDVVTTIVDYRISALRQFAGFAIPPEQRLCIQQRSHSKPRSLSSLSLRAANASGHAEIFPTSLPATRFLRADPIATIIATGSLPRAITTSLPAAAS